MKYIKLSIRPLIKLKLHALRDFYHKFKFVSKGKLGKMTLGLNYLFITYRTLEELNLLHRFMTKVVFDELERKGKLNFYELLFLTVWVSSSKINHKVKFLFLLVCGKRE